MQNLESQTPSMTQTPSTLRTLGIWELAWPTMLGSALAVLVRWVDFKMVGDLGMEAVAGVAAGGQIYWIVQTMVMALVTGVVALVARAFGGGDGRLADGTLRQSIVLGSLFGLGAWLGTIIILDDSLAILGVDEAVVDYGSEYLFWLLAGNVPFVISLVFGAASRAAGDVRMPLYIGGAANLLNVGLNWILIYGHWGAPALGVAGAGMASSLSMLAQVVVFWWLWADRRLLLKPMGASFWPDFSLWRRILRIGYPAALEGFAYQGGILLFIRIVSAYGTAEFTAYQIGSQILMVFMLPGFGFATAAATLVGQHLGEGEPQRAADSGWRSMWMSMASMSALGVVMAVFARPLARWFLDSGDVVDLTVDFIWILGVCLPLLAIEFSISGALRGAGDTRFPLFVILASLFMFRMVPATIAADLFDASIQLVWWTLILDYSVKAVLFIGRFRSAAWQKIEV